MSLAAHEELEQGASSYLVSAKSTKSPSSVYEPLWLSLQKHMVNCLAIVFINTCAPLLHKLALNDELYPMCCLLLFLIKCKKR